MKPAAEFIPIHYASVRLNICTIDEVIATQRCCHGKQMLVLKNNMEKYRALLSTSVSLALAFWPGIKKQNNE